MSGGVDSAVAAARAVDAGHEVVGVHLALSRDPATSRTGARGCCTVEDARDARRAADVLGIPFYVWDLAEQFTEAVVDDFVAEYAAGRTPNPCVRCNERVKFSALLDKALALGFDALVTGHYARVVDDGGRPSLHRALDGAKDQSYVLAVLTPGRLARALFPLGDAVDKAEVRAEAERRGLMVADKPDSHDICFVPDGDTRAWLGARIPSRPGAVLGSDGEVLGTHAGAAGYTVGQRRGLSLGTPAPDGRPRYVLEVSTTDNTVTVGSAEQLVTDVVVGGPPTWCGPAPAVGARLVAQVQAHGREVGCVVEQVDPELVVRVPGGLRAVAPGQTVVLYEGTRVVGSATVGVQRGTS
jgi:tRNA-specific 2-thiouridylase